MGSGKVRRTVTEVTGSTETLLAHNLPDMAGAIAMPVCMVVMLFLYDWRYGVACLIPVALSFAVMMRMAGPAMQEDMRQYQNALERMSNEAVEYVRGVPVVKTFGQTVFSFHRFKASIDDYCEFCMHYTRMMRKSMVGYTVLINSAFVFILGLTLFLIRGDNYQMDILLNFLFYVIFTPAIATAMTKVIRVDEDCPWVDVLTDNFTRFIINDIDIRLCKIRHTKQAIGKRRVIHIQSQVEEDFFNVDSHRCLQCFSTVPVKERFCFFFQIFSIQIRYHVLR